MLPEHSTKLEKDNGKRNFLSKRKLSKSNGHAVSKLRIGRFTILNGRDK